MRLGVLGAGAWGTALAVVQSARHQVVLWSRDQAQAAQMNATRMNARYLQGVSLSPSMIVTADFATAVHKADLLVVAVPLSGLRQTLAGVQASGCRANVVWLCKGFERDSTRLPHQVAQQSLATGTAFGALSGPSFADEVARGQPAAVTMAAHDPAFASDAARVFHTGRFRVYSTDDLIGVEVGGAVKNVIAIAAGICDGLQLGASARAALITRGLAEITRFGLKLGGRLETFMGLSGVGDLALTCTSDLSRNRRVGLSLARGGSLAETLTRLGHVAEGVHTAREVLEVAKTLGVEMPIAQAVANVVSGQSTPQQAVQDLLQRDVKSERIF
jgi:glycerol-3-phosphate dehydrogenase (NAD(P)+)